MFQDVIENGKNIKMQKIADCINDETWTLEDCEQKCQKYYSCYAVAEANDILRRYEDNHMSAKE